MSINEIIMSLEIGLIYGIVAIGIYLTFRVINFPDLTCDGSFVLGAATSSMIIKYSYNPFVALFIAFVSGGVAGFVTGILNTKFKITDLLSGILVAFMLYSINLHVMGGLPNIALIGVSTVFSNVSAIVLLLAICFIVCGVLSYLFATDFGLAIRSIGQNVKLSRSVGVNIKVMTVITLVISNALIALGGALFSQHQGFADVSSGFGTLIVGLASVVIGERVLPYRSLWVKLFSCLLGAILYRLFISFALHSEVLGLETQDLNLVTGIMIVGVMMIPRRRSC